MKRLAQFSIGVFLLITGLQLNAQQTVLLRGKVVGRNSKTIVIIPRTTSLRAEDKPIITIVNNQFEYKLDAKNVEAYELVFEDELEKGAWRPVIIFPDTSVIEMTLNDMDNFDLNVIKGGKLNREYDAFNRTITDRYRLDKERFAARTKILYNSKQYYSQAFEDLMVEIRKTKTGGEAMPFYEKREALEKTGKDLTPAGLLVKESYDSLAIAMNKWKYAILKKNVTINNFYLMYDDAQYFAKKNRYLTMLMDETFKIYAAKFPDHLYTKVIGDALSGIIKIFPGNKFVDFTAPDLSGKMFTLSKEINGKVALIDLWGSWCGPCIAKAQLVVPIFQKYKEKGFTVVGIAREFKDTNALQNRLKQERFSWLNLVELDDKSGIWNKYSISNGAGIQVLVDEKGIILAVDPTAAELEAILKKLFKG